jgi:hypothetical protein
LRGAPSPGGANGHARGVGRLPCGGDKNTGGGNVVALSS